MTMEVSSEDTGNTGSSMHCHVPAIHQGGQQGPAVRGGWDLMVNIPGGRAIISAH